MKMNFLFGNAFWGTLIVLFGLTLILKEFRIDLPLVKIFIAIIIIMFGIRLLVGGSCSIRTSRTTPRIYTSGSSEYSVVFSSQTIDLTGMKPDSNPLEVTAVFGTAYVNLPDDIEFEFESTSVFGSVDVPQRPQTIPVAAGKVMIEATAVFGKLEFNYLPATRAKTSAYTDSTSFGSGEQPD